MTNSSPATLFLHLWKNQQEKDLWCVTKKTERSFDSGKKKSAHGCFFAGFVWLLAFFGVRQRPRLIRCSAFVVVPSTVPNSLPPAVFAMRGRPGESNWRRGFPEEKRWSLNGPMTWICTLAGWLAGIFVGDILKSKNLKNLLEDQHPGQCT